MTVHFFDTKKKELINIKAEIFIPGEKRLAPHKVIQDIAGDEVLTYDSDRYVISYIGL